MSLVPRELELLAEAILSAKAGEPVKALGLCTTYLDGELGPPMWLGARAQLEPFVAALVDAANHDGFDWGPEMVAREKDNLADALGTRPAEERVHLAPPYMRLAFWFGDPGTEPFLAWVVNTETRMARALLERPPHGFRQSDREKLRMECDHPHKQDLLGPKPPHSPLECGKPTMPERLGGELP